jgi:3-deoxy-D-manno-octulosonic-acid transferase
MRIVGSLKFDQELTRLDSTRRIPKKSLGIGDDTHLMVAGSTRPGEEEIILEACRKLQNRHRLSLVLAPRHLDRISEIELLLRQNNFNYQKKSQLSAKTDQQFEVLLLDTMGELSHIYTAADLAFVGGSLVPLGGHNPLEPAACGIPVLFGPYMEHSQAAADLLERTGLGYRVRDAEEFFKRADSVLTNGCDTARLSATFRQALRQESGAASKTAELLFRTLSAGSA